MVSGIKGEGGKDPIKLSLSYLRWLKTVSSTFQDVAFDE